MYYSRTIKLCSAAAIAALPVTGYAQVATKIIGEGDAISYTTSGGTVNTTVDVIRFAGDANQVGGFVVQLDTEDDASHIYGTLDGGTPFNVIRTAGAINTLTQTQFDGEIGLADDGTVGYVATFDDGLITGIKGVFLDDTVVARADQPNTPDNFLDLRLTNAGTVSYLTDVTREGLFAGNPPVQTSLAPGDDVTLAGSNTLTIDNIENRQHGFSETGGNIIVADVDTGASTNDDLVLLNNAPVASGAGNIKEGDDATPNGGVGNWDNFDFVDINSDGNWILTGDTAGDSNQDEFLAFNGQVVVKQGDTISEGDVGAAIEAAVLNEDNDWAATWDIVQNGVSSEAILFGTGSDLPSVLIQVGDLVEVDGNLVALTSLNSGLVLTDRRADGSFDIYFQGRVGTSDDIQFQLTIPEPTSAALLGLATLAVACRRRRA
ncbi:MAG: PEP-CTERM sorting domain-containing protein [Planctomycetota bacterium]